MKLHGKTAKKNLLLLSLLFVPLFAFCRDITVMTFNIAHNSSYKKQHREEWINAIAEVARDNGADIILLQEVPVELQSGFAKHYYGDIEIHFKRPKRRTILDEIRMELGENWSFFSTADYLLHDGITVDGVSYSGGDMAQNNAIFYDGSVLSAEDLSDSLGFRSFPACRYRFNKNNVQAARFTVLPEEGEEDVHFVISNVHLTSKNSIEKRDWDLHTLYDMLLNEYGGEISDEPVMAGGDFNTNRDEFTRKGFSGYIVDGRTSPRTTLSTAKPGFRYVNDYDHFVYNTAMMEHVKKPAERASVGNGGNNFEKAGSVEIAGIVSASSGEFREKISDHVPLIIVLEF